MRRWWPKFENLRAAKEWAHFAAWITAVGTIATAAVGAYQIAYGTFDVPVWQLLVNILILATLTALMFRFSRIASIVALLLYLLNAIGLLVAFPASRSSYCVFWLFCPHFC
jgi:hypothetical protein